MSAAAKRLLESVPDGARGKLRLAFDDRAREDWHFIPRTRPGMTLGEMNDAQKTAARGLLRAALSSQGALKVEEIASLESVLRETENNPERDPLACTFTIYGDPGAASGWGWKVEGHHISLNFTCVDGRVASVTPAFLGSNPAEVKSGPRAGLSVLSIEEELGRRLLLALTTPQRAEAVIADKAPADIITAPGRALDSVPDAGLAYAKMTQEQKGMLDELLEEYTHTLRHDLAHAELDRIKDAGMDKVYFAWAGGSKTGEGHYYRISGPTFVIEFDNTQNNANHIHTVWHDRIKDFGKDMLREHYEHEHTHAK